MTKHKNQLIGVTPNNAFFKDIATKDCSYLKIESPAVRLGAPTLGRALNTDIHMHDNRHIPVLMPHNNRLVYMLPERLTIIEPEDYPELFI